jgi:hypothetical protein
MLPVIAALHIIALYFFLYWQIPWFDKIVHFLWGFWAVLFVFNFLIYKEYFIPEHRNSRSFFLISLVLAFFIGLLWEFFESQGGITNVHSISFIVDSSSDILMDLVGGIIASAYVFKTYKKKIKTNE